MSSLKNVLVPDIGDFKDIPVVEVLVKPGDSVSEEDSIITLESDKATMEVPAPMSGTVKEIKVNPGDTVSEGSLILSIEELATRVSDPEEKKEANTASSKQQETSGAPVPLAPSREESIGKNQTPDSSIMHIAHEEVHAGPGTRRLARELGVDLTLLKGTGQKKRILKEDIHAWVKKSLTSEYQTREIKSQSVLGFPDVDHSKFGKIEELPLSRIKKISGPVLHRNWTQIPHVTQNHEVDVTELEIFRKQLAEKHHPLKITPIVFIIKALTVVLKRYPDFNSSLKLSGDMIVRKDYVNIGVAVDTKDGLVVPVIKDVLSKGIIEIATDLQSLSEKARKGKLKMQDIEGGTFSVSSLGGIGGGHFTPIINAPEVAILGVNRAFIKPVWDGEQFAPKKMLPLSLSYDHRVIDGAEGSRFIVDLAVVLEDLRNALL